MAVVPEKVQTKKKEKEKDKTAAGADEFGGPLGAACITLFLPLLSLLLSEACSEPALGEVPRRADRHVTALIASAGSCSINALPRRLAFRFSSLVANGVSVDSIMTAIGVVLGYLGFTLALHCLLPGERALGAALPTGARLSYKLNAMAVLAMSLLSFFTMCYMGIIDPVYVYDHTVLLMVVAIVFCYAMSAWLYASARRRRRASGGEKEEVLLAHGGDTGIAVYDFFIGHELNPRLHLASIFGHDVDLKEFFELTPGLIAWLLLDVCCAFKQHALHGHVSNAMLLVCGFHALYVLDALYLEKAILTTMDITTDGLGFMLVFGDLVWVPFTYSLQARFLALHGAADLPTWAALAILALNIVGYYIFRGSNNQKNMFRTLGHDHPSNAHVRYIDTERGTRLMVSGWWGIARHINYTGDWIMGLAWSLPCGLSHALPYFYPAYFACLLLHREGRDEHLCRGKYGRDWDKYKRIVPYRLVPGVY